MKHHRWPVNLGIAVLLAGGWSLPVVASEVLPESVPVEADPIQLAPHEIPAGTGTIAPQSPAIVSPEQFPPSATPLESAISSLSVTPVIPRSGEVNQVKPPAPLSAQQFFSAPEFSGFVTATPGDRFQPEFAQAVFQEAPINELPQCEQAKEAPPIVIIQTDPVIQDDDCLIVQTTEETESLAEEASQLDPADSVLDNDGDVPVGDLLESVDGLEDSGIAGEGAITEEPSPEINGDDTAEGDDGSEAVQQPDQSSDTDEDEVEDLSAPEALETEEFDSEDFEAEEFEFEDDELEEAAPNSSEAAGDDESAGDPELGILRLRERPLAKKKTPLKIPVFLVGNVGYIGNGNTLAGVDPVNDRLFRRGLSLIASPRLSKRTALIASVQGNLNRYDELSRLDYNEVRLQTSLRHVFTRNVYGDLGWTHRQLFLQEDGDRFLYEHAAFASLTRRDKLTKKTSLTSFYNLRAGFADPETSSRLRNTLGVSLRHDITPALQASLTGRMTLTNFTQQSRQDFYSQALAQLSYKVSKNVRLSAFGSLTRGNSSNRRVDFDNSTIGVSLSGNVKLF